MFINLKTLMVLGHVKLHTHSRLFDASMLSTSAKLLQTWRYPGIKSTQYPTHILSHTYYLPMCICSDIGRQKSQKSSFIHTHSTFRCFYALNCRQTAANIQIFRRPVHTGAPHTFCLTTTTFPCVFVKK
jgi:hypothetical protein